MGRVTQVFNRNGEIVPFRRNRIVRAILAAVRTAGSKDEWVADKLADMVVYFLDMQHGDGATPPQAEDVDDMIEKALLSSPDLHPIAQAFIAGRQQRREIRELEENVSSQPAQGPQVAQPDQGLGGWNPARIAAAVMRENSLDATIAGEVAAAVERKMQELNLPLVTTGLIRELVDVELLSRGLITEPGSVSIPRFDLEQWVFPGEDTDVPPVTEQAELSERASRRVLSQYALHSILPAPVREAHIDGRLQFEALHAPAAVVGTRLDVAALLGAGAGFGLQRMFAESTAGIGAALSSGAPGSDENLSTREWMERIEKAVSELPSTYRAVFHLRDVEGLSNVEVAEALNLTLPNVKSRIHRARLVLRTKLSDYLGN